MSICAESLRQKGTKSTNFSWRSGSFSLINRNLDHSISQEGFMMDCAAVDRWPVQAATADDVVRAQFQVLQIFRRIQDVSGLDWTVLDDLAETDTQVAETLAEARKWMAWAEREEAFLGKGRLLDLNDQWVVDHPKLYYHLVEH